MKKSNNKIRLLFSILLIPTGAVLTMLQLSSPIGELISDIGLAIIVAGIVSTFHESVIRKLDRDESSECTADKVFEKIKEAPLSAIGIRMLSSVRKGYEGYYLWAMDTDPSDMFFAGRSVLHRITADFQVRQIGDAETIIARRLLEGSTLKVLILDARSEMIPRLALEEGQTSEQLYSDLATSLGICKRLYEQLDNCELPARTRIEVDVFDEIPYFAYHKVDHNVIVGFYFSSAVGHTSAAFEIVDPKTKEFFGQHFNSILGRATNDFIIKSNPHSGKTEINDKLITELTTVFINKLGQEKAINLINGLNNR